MILHYAQFCMTDIFLLVLLPASSSVVVDVSTAASVQTTFSTPKLMAHFQTTTFTSGHDTFQCATYFHHLKTISFKDPHDLTLLDVDYSRPIHQDSYSVFLDEISLLQTKLQDSQAKNLINKSTIIFNYWQCLIYTYLHPLHKTSPIS